MKKIIKFIFVIIGGFILLFQINSFISEVEGQVITQEHYSSHSHEEWNLTLVNKWNPIQLEYQKPDLISIDKEQFVDRRIYHELREMLNQAKRAGMMPKITSSYRTENDQIILLQEKVSDYKSKGYSTKRAQFLAEKSVAKPNTSEHQLGLAVDISSANSRLQNPSVIWQWLNQNSYKYGFILRYPEEKVTQTGVVYEPWHYRYVGKEAAKEIYNQKICLEEYLYMKN